VCDGYRNKCEFTVGMFACPFVSWST
jgi:hypothetical protein